MELDSETTGRVREAVADALTRDDMSAHDIADMAAGIVFGSLSRQAEQEQVDRKVNLAARYLAASPADPDTLPVVIVAGADVFAYVDSGKLRVSVGLDDTGSSGYWQRDAEAIPMEVTVNGETVFAADSSGRVAVTRHTGMTWWGKEKE